MKFISWNVNGLRACVKKGFTEFFEQTDADFFCIQETKLQEGQIDFEPEGYFCYWNYAVKKGYSGTAIFAKKEPLSVQYGIGIEEHDQEGRVITLEYENFYMVTVYTPNSQSELARLSYRMQWEDDFRAYLQQLDEKKPVIMCGDLKETPPSETQTLKKRKPIIICGDFNVAVEDIDIKNPRTNHNSAGFTDAEREQFRNLLASGYTDTYRYLHPDEIKYSWWSYRFKAREKNIGWRLDYFLLSDFANDKIKNAEIMTDIYGSDHCPVLLDVDV